MSLQCQTKGPSDAIRIDSNSESVMRHLILPFVMVSVALNIAGCALKFDLQGNYKGMVDPSKVGQGRHVNEYTPAEYRRNQGLALLSAHGFTSSSFKPQGK